MLVVESLVTVHLYLMPLKPTAILLVNLAISIPCPLNSPMMLISFAPNAPSSLFTNWQTPTLPVPAPPGNTAVPSLASLTKNLFDERWRKI